MKRKALMVASMVFALAGCHSSIEPQRPLASEAAAPRCMQDRLGVGMTIQFDDAADEWVVTAVWPGAPAEVAGIRPGDHIRNIDGVELRRNLAATRVYVDELSKSSERTKCDSAIAEIAAAFQRKLQSRRNGEIVKIGYVREGAAVQSAQVEVASLADIFERANELQPPGALAIPVCYVCSSGPPCQQTCEGYDSCALCAKECIAC